MRDPLKKKKKEAVITAVCQGRDRLAAQALRATVAFASFVGSAVTEPLANYHLFVTAGCRGRNVINL